MYAHEVLSLSEDAVDGHRRAELFQPVQAVNSILVIEIARRLLDSRTRKSYAIRLVWVRCGGEIAKSVFLPRRADERE